MKRKASGVHDGRKRWRWGFLMSGAFLAGLLVVGVALLLPGQGRREPGPVSPLSPAPLSPAAQLPPAPAPPPLPRLAIVVDGLGYEPSRDAEWMKFPEKITVAVIPFGPSSRKVAESARTRGWGVILHVPMEPESPASDRTERFRMTRGMSAEDMESLFTRMTEDIPQARGASNHMGSAFTADPEAMAKFVSILGRKGFFLLDSVTTSRSSALEAAQRAGVPAARRDVFLNAQMKPEEMREQWEKAIAVAKEKGAAVLICNGRTDALNAILDLLPGLRKEKIQPALLEELLKEKAG